MSKEMKTSHVKESEKWACQILKAVSSPHKESPKPRGQAFGSLPRSFFASCIFSPRATARPYNMADINDQIAALVP